MTTLEKLQAIDDDGEGLTPWEVELVANLVDRGAVRFTPAQREMIDTIHTERVPK